MKLKMKGGEGDEKTNKSRDGNHFGIVDKTMKSQLPQWICILRNETVNMLELVRKFLSHQLPYSVIYSNDIYHPLINDPMSCGHTIDCNLNHTRRNNTTFRSEAK